MIIRGKWQRDFTIVPNAVFHRGLSPEATGVVCYLIGRPEDWKVSVQALANHFDCGRRKMLRVMDELTNLGFATKKIGGQGGGFDWLITDNPSCAKEPDSSGELEQNAIVAKRDSRKTRQSRFEPLQRTEEELRTEEEPRTSATAASPVVSRSASAPKPATKLELPAEINAEAWADFEAHRKLIKMPLSDLARRKAFKQLAGLSAQQQAECIDMTIVNNWRGLFPSKVSKPSDKLNGQASTQFSRGAL